MRLVAAALPALLLLSALPTTLAVDECSTLLCQKFSTNDAPDERARATFYVYAQGLTCPTSAACRGAPPAQGYGLLWQESNHQAGLQRTRSFDGDLVPPDKLLLA